MATALPTTGLIGRFRAGSITGITNGAAITSWPDLAGSRTLVPRTSAPTLVTGGANGKTSVLFNGTNQDLKMDNPPTVAQPYTVVVVIAMTSVPTSEKQIWWQGAGGEVSVSATGNWGNYAGAYRSTTQTATTSPTVVTSVFDGAGSLSQMFVNGTVGVTSNVGAGAMDQSLLVVGNHGSQSKFLPARIYEIALFNHATTASERAQIHSYVQDEYGITVADYVASTPADTTAPTISSFTATAGNGQAALAWTATDDVAVTNSTITRGGTQVYSGTASSFTDTGLTNGTAYAWTLTVRDAAGNTKTATATATPVAPGRAVDRWTGSSLSRQKTERWSGSALLARVVEFSSAIAAGGTAGYPQALGSLTARPSWTNATVAAGPVDQPAVSTRTRTLELPNLPVAGGDITAAWTAYFGNQTGTAGTKQAGDRVTIPAGNWVHSGVLDIPPSTSDVEIVLGTSTAACVLTATDATSGNSTPPRIGMRVLSANNITIRAASSAYPAVHRSTGIAGRGDKNQQGHCLLEVEFCTGFRAQDLILQDSKAAGFFAYGADHYWLNRVRVERSKADAFHATNGSSYGIYSDCSSDNAGDDMMAFVHYDERDPATSVSHHMEVYRYTGKRNGHGRGFAVIATHDIYADQVIIEGSAAASVIIDREPQNGAQPSQSIYNVLLQRFSIAGANWSEQDHNGIFIGNSDTGATVTAQLESFTNRDSRYYGVARAVGSGQMNVVFKDFLFTGLLASTDFSNRTKIGGNWTAPSTMTQTNWVIDTSSQVDTTAPTVVINTPGQLATVTGTLTGSVGGSTDQMTNTQAIQFYVGDNGGGDGSTGIASYTVKVDGSTANGLGTPTTLDAAGRGSCTWNTTTVANGTHTITVTATDKTGLVTTRNITVTVAN